MYMYALGRLFDLGTGTVPVDLDTANNTTGKRCSLQSAAGITFVVQTAAGPTTDIVLDVQQHTAYVNGTTADLDSTAVTGSVGITEWWIKSEAVLDNDEAWVRTTQAEASEITITGATWGDKQKIIVVEVSATQLADGYSHISLDITSSLGATLPMSTLYVLHDLAVQRKPTALPNLLRPGAANA